MCTQDGVGTLAVLLSQCVERHPVRSTRPSALQTVPAAPRVEVLAVEASVRSLEVTSDEKLSHKVVSL